MKQAHNVTFGVNTTGNLPALLMTLSSVLNAAAVPKSVLVRFEGEFPGFGDFYLEQLAALARLKKVGFTIEIGKGTGVRDARDALLESCRTEILWMGDDDVLYSPNCLANFLAIEQNFLRQHNSWAYLVGTKPDVNNRRGYPDFGTKTLKAEDYKDDCSFNQFWEELCPKTVYPVQMHTADTGNLFINVSRLEPSVRFRQASEHANSGGEDTLFAAQCWQSGLVGLFHPALQSVHLEKPRVRFGEFEARTEMLLRTFELKGYDKRWLDGFMPFVKRG